MICEVLSSLLLLFALCAALQSSIYIPLKCERRKNQRQSQRIGELCPSFSFVKFKRNFICWMCIPTHLIPFAMHFISISFRFVSFDHLIRSFYAILLDSCCFFISFVVVIVFVAWAAHNLKFIFILWLCLYVVIRQK